jgi:serine/threonine protein kinase
MDLCFDKNRTLNTGGFGIIYKVDNTAVKVVHHRHGSIQNILELILYFSLSTYLIQAFTYELNKSCYKIYMPLANYDFSKTLKMKIPKCFDIMLILHNICLGVEYLHSRNIVHGDIKPSNILIFKDNKKYVAKLSDFSLSGLCFDRINNKYAYTIGYRAPEVELKGSYDFKADIWALGQTFKKAQDKFPELKDKKFMDLIHNMTLSKEEERYDIYKVLSHPYFERYKPPDAKPSNIIKFLEMSQERVFLSKLINKMMRRFVQEDESFIDQEILHAEFLIRYFKSEIF